MDWEDLPGVCFKNR